MRRNRETLEEKKARLDRIESVWLGFSYGSNQFVPYSAEIEHPDFCFGMKSAVKDVYRTLVFLAWKNENWIIDATADFLAYPLAHRGMKAAAILRHPQELNRRGLIHSQRGKYGKGHLINPIGLVAKTEKKLIGEAMENYLKARLHFCQIDHFDRSGRQFEIDQNDRADRSKGSIWEKALSLEIDQNDRHILGSRLTRSGAPCHSSNNSQGGEGDLEKRSPNGQDQTGEQKGVASGDGIATRARIEVERTVAAIEARMRVGNEKEQVPCLG